MRSKKLFWDGTEASHCKTHFHTGQVFEFPIIFILNLQEIVGFIRSFKTAFNSNTRDEEK